MTSKLLRGCLGLAALVMCASLASNASAFCGSCGTGGAVAYAQPVTYQAAYAPVAYTANYGSGSGWWPGCCLGNLFGWGSQPTYAVSYAPTYAVSYAPACASCSTCSPCTSCATPCTSCTSCSPCGSCAQQVTMRPVCETSCMPSCGCSDCGTSCSSCSGCASCGGSSTVTQAVYQQPGCSSCGNSAAVVVPAQSGTTTVIQGGTVPGGQTPPPPNGTPEPQPMLTPSDNPAGERQTFESQRPIESNGVQPGPVDDSNPAETVPTNDDGNANYLEAPKLFNPMDRTAARVAAPVWHAVYKKPVAYHRVSTGRITAAQAEADAAGWSSPSK